MLVVPDASSRYTSRTRVNRIRVLHFAWRLSRGGGIPIVLRSFLPRIDRSDFEHHVVTVRPHYPEDRVHEVGPHTFHSLELDGKVAWLRNGLVVSRLAAIFHRIRPGLLHSHGGTAWYTAPWATAQPGLRGRILEVHDAPHSKRLQPWNYMAEGFMLRRLGYTALVHSQDVREGVARAARIAEDRIAYVPLGIDTAAFASPKTPPAAWRKMHGIQPGSRVVLYVARVAPTKNVPLYLQVAESVLAQEPNTCFLMIGTGTQLEAVSRSPIALAHPQRIRFLGRRFGPDLVDAFHAADVFLTTSNYEGFGLVVVEAMAAGKPVVTTACGGVLDIVRHGVTGFVAPVGHRDSLAEATLRLVRDPSLSERLGQAGRARARELYDVNPMVRGFEDLYRRLTS